MFVFKIKLPKRRLAISFLCFCLLATFMLCVSITRGESYPEGSDEKLRKAYIYSLGYRVESRDYKKETAIPENFSEAYEMYNDKQRLVGFDLSKFKGEKVTLYGYKTKDTKNLLTLIVWRGRIIGGDVFSLEKGEISPLKKQ